MIDETGNKYGNLTVIRKTEKPVNVISKEIWFLCKCDCGNTTVVRGHCLRRGETVSCGCKRRNKMPINLIGNRYGKLVVLEIQKSVASRKGARWLCQCDCGNTKVVDASNLKSGNVRSCGCISKLPKGEASFNAIYRRYKAGAVSRGYSFEIDVNTFRKLINMSCFYCGAEPSNVERPRKYGDDYVYNGIDRVDNTRGYEIDNVVPCCGQCNVHKMDYGISDFREWIVRIYNHFILGGDSNQ